MLFDIAQLARTQPFAERFGAVANMPGTHQKLGEVRSCGRVTAVAKFLLHGPCAFQCSRHAFRGQPLRDEFGTAPAPFAQLANGLLQRGGIAGKTIAEHVNGRTIPDTGQLDAIDQPDAQRRGRGMRLLQAL